MAGGKGGVAKSVAQAPGAAFWRVAPWVAAAAACLSLVTCLNGFPLVFPDTGTYLRQAMRLEGSLDRPPFYSLFIFPIHRLGGLWMIPVVQNLLVVGAIFRAGDIAFPALRPRDLAAICAGACLVTSLPWYSNQIMPDIFSPLLVLAIFCLVLGWRQLGRRERLGWFAALLVMDSFHNANPLFSVTMAVGAGGLAVWQGEVAGDVGRRVLLVMAAAAIAVSAQATYGFVVIGRVTPSPAAPFFTLARLIYDGPARRYLADACPEAGYVLCAYQQQFTGTSDNFLWDETMPLHALILARKERGALDEASAIVRGTVARYPGAVLDSALGNGVRQFFAVATPIALCPCLGGKLGRVMPELFPRDVTAFTQSLQNQDRLPWGAVRWVDWLALGAAILALVSVVVQTPCRLGGLPGALLALIVWALLVNAMIMGGLSGVTDRYQARMVWLLPLLAAALHLSFRRSAHEE
jgi:hypothetical protein